LINGIEYGPFTNIGDNKLIFFDQYFAIPHYRFDGQKNVERPSYYLEIGDEVFGPFADDESESGDILELYSGKFLNQIVDGKRYWFSETGLFYGPFEDSNLSIEKQMDYISEEEQKKTFLLEESNHMYYFYHRAERKGPYYEAFLEINDGLYQLVYREYKNNEDGYQYPADWWVEIESL
ncbi:hypothetical protein KKC60_05825, partial [Patescibacteria group bacterium]|nr:hypothetical protein [Patescibacteria group bacterium]